MTVTASRMQVEYDCGSFTANPALEHPVEQVSPAIRAVKTKDAAAKHLSALENTEGKKRNAYEASEGGGTSSCTTHGRGRVFQQLGRYHRRFRLASNSACCEDPMHTQTDMIVFLPWVVVSLCDSC